MAFGIGIQELIIILVIFLLLFGGKKLPELARSLGSSINIFKKSMKEGSEESAAKGTKKKFKNK